MSGDWRRVTREEWRAFVARFPDRWSCKTAMGHPPEQITYATAPTPDGLGKAIASITFGDWPEGRAQPDWDAKVYRIDVGAEP